jgi:RHS repeat-associated protein
MCFAYYPFGMTMPGRTFSAGTSYRYGFNGKETSQEISSGAISFEARIYDSRLGRFLSTDPLTSLQPFQSCYSFASNTPIAAIDNKGEITIFVTIVYRNADGSEIYRASFIREVLTIEELLTGIERTPYSITGISLQHINEEGVFMYRYCNTWQQNCSAASRIPGGLNNWERHAQDPQNNAFDNLMYFVYEPLIDKSGIGKLIIAGEGEDLEGNKYDGLSRIVKGLEGGLEFWDLLSGRGGSKVSANNIITDVAGKTMAKKIIGVALKVFKENTKDEALKVTAEIIANTVTRLIDASDIKEVGAKDALVLIINVLSDIEKVKDLQNLLNARGNILAIDHSDAVSSFISAYQKENDAFAPNKPIVITPQKN